MIFRTAVLVAATVAGFLSLLANFSAWPQHNHQLGHNDYLNWSSGKVTNCCNNQDCGALKDDEWRENRDGIEIKINGTWCPVRPEHFIRTGKSPDWTTAHACISPNPWSPPCDRLLCFSGIGKF